MTQFGAGPEFAAQCPSAPTPDGWRPWIDADGPMPEGLAQHAERLAVDQSVPLGTTESHPIPGITTLIRVEPRVWARDEQGSLVKGCFRTGVVYLPSGTPAVTTTIAPPMSKMAKAAMTLTVVSLTVGIAATLARWGKT
jgi:hypothetical protein